MIFKQCNHCCLRDSFSTVNQAN
uniref:Uncharacterized protein n=1 Tax=Anguilla anguilla TaxID=7936 RepID=A0A0E9TRL2_ANGAN